MLVTNRQVQGSYVAMLDKFGQICLLVYIIIGLALSGVTQISRLAAVFSLFGVVVLLLRVNRLPPFLSTILPALLYIAASWIWAIDADVNILGNYLTSVMGAIVIIGAVYCGWVRPSTLIYLLLIPTLLNIYAYIVGINLTETIYDLDDEHAIRRFGGFIGHPSPLVTRLIGPFVIFLMFRSFMKPGIKRKILGLLTFASAIFAIYVSGSKKSILLLAPAILIWLYIVYSEVRARSSKGSYFIFATAALVLVYFGLSFFITSGALDDIEVFKRFESFLFQSDESTDERASLIFIAIRLISSSPIFGHGLDQFSVLSGVGFYSHNNFLELLTNTGLIGLMLYYLGVYGALLRISKSSGIIALLLFGLLTVLDVTGITYSDRGSQVIIFSILFVASLRMKFKN